MPDRSYLVLSAIGADRPGLVAALTRYIADHAGNVEDSRMAVLGGSFGIMILVSGTPEALARIISEAGGLERESGLRIHIDTTTAPRRGSGQRYAIEVEAADREGIVYAISGAVFDLGGNIVNLESAIYPAPVSGSPLFKLRLLVDVPPDVTREKLDAVLAEVARSEDLECHIETVEE